MIEIRDLEGEPVELNGPHSSEGTRAIAAGVDELVRMLNYATMPGNGGIVYPSTVYSVYGELIAALDKLPQALGQMSRWIAEQAAEGAIRENPSYGANDGDTQLAVNQLADSTRTACERATELARALGRAQSATRGLETVESGETRSHLR